MGEAWEHSGYVVSGYGAPGKPGDGGLEGIPTNASAYWPVTVEVPDDVEEYYEAYVVAVVYS